MSNALGAVLQGLERGAGMGLNMYQALNAEARAKRQEQFQINRANREDFVADRAHNTQLGRYEVEDKKWETNLDEERKRHNDLQAIRERQAAVYERGASLREAEFSHKRSQDEYNRQRTERAEREARSMTLFQASLIGDDGAYITDSRAYAERANGNPQIMKSILDTAVAMGMIDEDRANGYSGAQLVPTENGLVLRVAGKDGTGRAIRDGGAPLTANGTSDPDDPVVEINMTQLRQMADPAFRGAQQDSALLERDTEASRQELESRYERDIAGLDAQEAEMQAQLEASEARLAELEANKPAPPTSRMSEDEVRAARMAGIPLGDGWTTRNSAKGHAWEAEHAQVTQALEQARGFLDAAPRRREQMGEIRTNSLADIESNAERSRIEGGYATRSAERQASTAARRTAAVEAGTKAIDTAVKAHNAHGEKEYGKGFNGRLNQNEIRVEFGRLDPDIRAALVAQPGGIEYAVDLMGAIGATSFDYAIDTMQAQVNRDAYMDAVKDPALVTAGNGDPDVMHAYAMEYAKHKQRYPNAPKEASLQAITSGREPPKGK